MRCTRTREEEEEEEEGEGVRAGLSLLLHEESPPQSNLDNQLGTNDHLERLQTEW
jgi:hypothetical protein